MAITTAQIQQLYVAYLGRAADKAGLDYWDAQLNATPATLTLENLRANFVNEQPEYAAAYVGLNRTEIVSKIYLNLFGHPADAAGLAYWTTGDGASVNADQLLVAFINGASASDAKIVANKVLVSEVYTSTAGSNYTQADAKSIIAKVDGTTKSVQDALGHLEDGSLSGIAIPTGVAALKAAAIAADAATADGVAKVASLTAVNDKVVALNASYSATVNDLDGDADKTVTYDEASVIALDNAKALYTNISDGNSVDRLKLTATEKAALLKVQYDKLVSTHPDAVAEVKAYNDAVAANAKVKAVDPKDITIAEAALDSTITVKAADFAAANAAYKVAVPTAKAFVTADDLFKAIKAADSATLTKLDAAYGSLQHYSDVKTVAVADAAKEAAKLAQDKAEAAVGSAYVSAAEASAGATKVVADAQAADALVTQTEAVIAAHKVLADAAQVAHDAIPTGFTQDVDAPGTVVLGVATGTAKADLFYFSAIKAADDFSIKGFNKGDAIYVGEGYTLNKAATVDADGFFVGSNTAAKEVFFTQAADGTVSAVIETNAVGHVAGGAADNVAVIQLTGITSLSDVSFANGVITSNHVAVA